MCIIFILNKFNILLQNIIFFYNKGIQLYQAKFFTRFTLTSFAFADKRTNTTMSLVLYHKSRSVLDEANEYSFSRINDAVVHRGWRNRNFRVLLSRVRVCVCARETAKREIEAAYKLLQGAEMRWSVSCR